MSTPKTWALVAGQKLTIISISEGMAHTTRREVQLKTVTEPTFQPAYVRATRGKVRVGTFTQPPKRKEYHLDIRPNDVVLNGWNRKDMLIDSEYTEKTNGDAGGYSFSGNACLNLSCEAGPERLKAILDEENLNPAWNDEGRGRVLYTAEGTSPEDSVPLYPEIEIHHAVMERHRK